MAFALASNALNATAARFVMTPDAVMTSAPGVADAFASLRERAPTQSRERFDARRAAFSAARRGA